MVGNWTNEEKQEMVKVFTVLATIQKSYGNEINTRETLQAWQYVLSDYTASQVIEAMLAWMKKDNSMPTPADLIKIIAPPSPKITTAEYVNAKKWQELNYYSAYTPEAKLIREYEAQQAEDRTPEGAPCPQLMARAKAVIENESK